MNLSKLCQEADFRRLRAEKSLDFILSGSSDEKTKIAVNEIEKYIAKLREVIKLSFAECELQINISFYYSDLLQK